MLKRILSAGLLLAVAAPGAGPAAAGPVLDRIMAEKKIRLGFRTDAPPFAALVDGWPEGFSAELCILMATTLSADPALAALDGEMAAVDTANRFDALAAGEIDVLCGATTATLKRREIVSFTIPTYTTGVGAIIRRDAPAQVREVLATGGPKALAAVRPDGALAGAIFGVRADTTAADWLESGPLLTIENVAVKSVRNHQTGIDAVAAGAFVAYFADRAILLGLLKDHPDRAALVVSDAAFTYEPYALAIPRGDEDLRLFLDRVLSEIYRSGQIFEIYEKYFGPADAETRAFYRLMALPE